MNKFLQEKFKVFERLYLHYLLYLGVELTLGSKNITKKLKLGKKKLYEMKTVLLNTLAELKEQEPELKNHLARQTRIVRYNNRVNYINLEFDMDRAKFMIENGKSLFRNPKHEQAIILQHQRSLKRNLDLVILGVLYESLTGKPLNIEELTNTKNASGHIMPDHHTLADSPEGLMKLYKLNQSLIKYLREEIILELDEFFKVNRNSLDKKNLKKLIKKKLGQIIESYFIKHPTSHQRVTGYNLAHHL